MLINAVKIFYSFPGIIYNPIDFIFRDSEKIEFHKQMSLIVQNSIENPNMSLQGLRERKAHILLICNALTYLGVMLLVLLMGGSMLLNAPYMVVAILGSIPFYVMGTGAIMSIKLISASSDIRKFKKNPSDDFKINKFSKLRKFDYLPGIICAVLMFFILGSEFNLF